MPVTGGTSIEQSASPIISFRLASYDTPLVIYAYLGSVGIIVLGVGINPAQTCPLIQEAIPQLLLEKCVLDTFQDIQDIGLSGSEQVGIVGFLAVQKKCRL